ncbi:MAG: hypothetical protein ACSLFA_16780 [Mycobacterium sp.]
MTEQAELIAFYELTRAKATYCRTPDTKDWNGLADLMIMQDRAVFDRLEQKERDRRAWLAANDTPAPF